MPIIAHIRPPRNGSPHVTRLLERPEEMVTVTYYEGRTVLITREVFETELPTLQRFRVADLRNVQVTRCSSERRHLRNRPTWELRAVYHGRWVELFSTTDLQTFGQVKRALVRALEANFL